MKRHKDRKSVGREKAERLQVESLIGLKEENYFKEKYPLEDVVLV